MKTKKANLSLGHFAYERQKNDKLAVCVCCCNHSNKGCLWGTAGLNEVDLRSSDNALSLPSCADTHAFGLCLILNKEMQHSLTATKHHLVLFQSKPLVSQKNENPPLLVKIRLFPSYHQTLMLNKFYRTCHHIVFKFAGMENCVRSFVLDKTVGLLQSLKTRLPAYRQRPLVTLRVAC